MFGLVRKVVAGPKKCTIFEGSELDLTYITERVIAMAFPASDLIEKAYRNPIQVVAAYFLKHHQNHYLIINVSSRPYNYATFEYMVKEYNWPDHQAPPLTTLVQVAYDMYDYLKGGKQRVVAVHCNHGKGRTGTAIIALMLLTGYMSSAIECLKFYNSQRFESKTYGVDQPCQLRYLHYIQQLKEKKQLPNKLICYRLDRITHEGLDESYFIRISSTRTQKVIYKRVDFDSEVNDRHRSKLLLGDIFIELYNEGWMGPKRISRINCHTFFLGEDTTLTFKSRDIKLQQNANRQFSMTLHFKYNCLCHLQVYNQSVCSCKLSRVIQEKQWEQMISYIKECQKLNEQDSYSLLHTSLDVKRQYVKGKGSFGVEENRGVCKLDAKKAKEGRNSFGKGRDGGGRQNRIQLMIAQKLELWKEKASVRLCQENKEDQDIQNYENIVSQSSIAH